MDFVNDIYIDTLNFINNVPKALRKEIGQFFTSPTVARYMGSLMTYSNEHIDILDAGAGSGILTASLCEEILKNKQIKSVDVDLYENNDAILPILISNMNTLKEVLKVEGISFSYRIMNENFICSNSHYWKENNGTISGLYDVIISNPPYKKIGKNDLEAVSMPEVVHGQPNIYFLFMAMSAKLLKENGQMIFITPRSFSNGAYFQKFRKWFFNNVKLTHLHLFVSRADVFEGDSILQETIILKAVKTTKRIHTVSISQCENMDDFENQKTFVVPYKTIVNSDDDNCFMLMPTNQKDIDTISFVNRWKNNLVSLGYKLKTGPVVDFRATEFLRGEEEKDTAPLFWAHNFQNNRINFPVLVDKKPQYIVKSEVRLLIKNQNYIFLKRFTSKEEKRRLQSVLYFKEDFESFDYIGVENHLNYITKINGTMSKQELYGLFVLLNSSVFDRYFRILNGSTQVNANEMNSIPFPNIEEILKLGSMIKEKNDFSVETCDLLLDEVFNKTDILQVV